MAIVNQYLVGPLSPSTVGGTGTTVKYFPNQPGTSFQVTALTPSSTNATGQLAWPGSNKLNGQWATVRAAGNYTAGSTAGSETVTIALVANTGTVLSPTYVTLGTTSAVAPPVDGVAASWGIISSLVGDTTSGIVGGTFSAYVNGVSVGTAAVVTPLTGINFGNDASRPPFGIVVGITFSVSNANNTANLFEFNINND